ncbi:MAG: VIT1/CCC1 transporter family protein [Flavobacteriales bacterium]
MGTSFVTFFWNIWKACDELGINNNSGANPIQAAIASGAAFTFGGLMPFLVIVLMQPSQVVWSLYFFTILFLMLLGGISASVGGSPIVKAIVRITIWGSLAMLASGIAGNILGTFMA